MLSRNILFIDDDDKLERFLLKRYERIAQEIKAKDEYTDYELLFFAARSIQEAKEMLVNRHLIVDVVVVDYQFLNSNNNENGTDLIEYIRDKINKRCKIIFYTMNGVDKIAQDELISLINNDVYRLIDKGRTDDDVLIRIIYDAVYNGDILVASLERFWNEYSETLSEGDYTVLGEKVEFADIIKHIRLDDEIGRVFADKFMHKALLEAVSF